MITHLNNGCKTKDLGHCSIRCSYIEQRTCRYRNKKWNTQFLSLTIEYKNFEYEKENSSIVIRSGMIWEIGKRSRSKRGLETTCYKIMNKLSHMIVFIPIKKNTHTESVTVLINR